MDLVKLDQLWINYKAFVTEHSFPLQLGENERNLILEYHKHTNAHLFHYRILTLKMSHYLKKAESVIIVFGVKKCQNWKMLEPFHANVI